MNIRKSSATEREVTRLYLYGFTIEEIAKKCKVSTGYVSGVINMLREELSEQEVWAIREFSTSLKKANVSTAQAFAGARIYSMIKRTGSDEDELQDLLKDVLSLCKNEGIELSKIIEYGRNISDFQAKSDMTLEELPLKVDSLLETKKDLEAQIASLKQESSNSKEECKTALNERNLTIEKVNEFERVRQELATHDFGFKDLQKLATVLKQGSEDGYDVGKIIRHLEKENQYEQRTEQYEQKVIQLRAKEANLTKEIKELSRKIDSKKSLTANIRRLGSIGVKEQLLEVLYGIILKVGKTHNIDEKIAFQKLCEDLQNHYDKTTGLKLYLEKLETGISLKSKELEYIQVRIENFNLKNKQNLDALNVIKILKQKGIDPYQIIIWHRIFESANVDTKIFEAKLRKYVQLNKIIAQEELYYSQIKKQKKDLESRIQWLQSKKEKLESQIDYANEIGVKKLDDAYKRGEERILDVKLRTNSLILGIYEDAINKMGNIEKTFVKKLQTIMEQLEKWATLSMKEFEKLGRLESITPLYDLVNDSKLDVAKQIPIVIIILDKLNREIKKQHASSYFLSSHIKSLREDLEEVLSKNERN